MQDSGYTDYNDPRLVPNTDESDVPTPSDCFESCAHAEACRAQLARLRGWDVDEEEAYWVDTLASDLGCDEGCDQYDENEAPALRQVCRQLIETVKVGEAECGCALMAHYLIAHLEELGFRVRE